MQKLEMKTVAQGTISDPWLLGSVESVLVSISQALISSFLVGSIDTIPFYPARLPMTSIVRCCNYERAAGTRNRRPWEDAGAADVRRYDNGRLNSRFYRYWAGNIFKTYLNILTLRDRLDTLLEKQPGGIAY